jgi:hypothetical protein
MDSSSAVIETQPSSPPAVAQVVPTLSRTYTGKSRSFLIAVPSTSYGVGAGDAGLGLGSQQEDPTQDGDMEEETESYADLRRRWGVDNSDHDFDEYHGAPKSEDEVEETQEDVMTIDVLPKKGKSQARPAPVPLAKRASLPKGKDRATERERAPPLPSGMMNDLKSITELRSKGENRRFLDEVGYLFEGMDPTGAIGLRRARSGSLCTRSVFVDSSSFQCIRDYEQDVRFRVCADG